MNHTKRLIFAAIVAIPAMALAAGAATPREAAEADLATLKARYTDADAVWKPGQPGAHVVVGLMSKPAGKTDLAKATAFLGAHRALVGVDRAGLRHIATSRSKHRIAVRFAQHHRGVPVLDRLVAVRLDHEGHVLGIVSDAMPVAKLPAARLPVADAREIAGLAAGLRDFDASKLPAERAILAMPGESRPVWVVEVTAAPLRAHLRVLVDAADGRVREITNHVKH